MWNHGNYTALFHSLYVSMYFILTRTVETLHKTNAIVFISHLSMHMFYQHTLPSAYWWIGRTEKKRNYSLSPLSFSFYVFLSPSSQLLVRSPSQPRCPPGSLVWLSCEKADVCTEGTGLGSPPHLPQSSRPSRCPGASAPSHVWKWNVPLPNGVSDFIIKIVVIIAWLSI